MRVGARALRRRGGTRQPRLTKLLPLLASLSTVSHAVEQRPLPIEFAVTDSIVMTDQDELYLSPAVQFFRLPDQKRLTAGSEIAYGFTDRLQLTTQIPYVFVDPDGGRATSGIGDVEVKGRYALLDYREHPYGLDIGLGLQLPTGDRRRDLGDGRVALAPSFTASAWLGPVNAQANGAWHHAFGAAAEPGDEGEYNLAFVYPIRRWFVVLEGNGESNHERTNYYVTPEVAWRATEALELRLAIPVPVTRTAGDYAVIAGFTIEFEHLLHPTEEG
jgi:hypothetical protein